MIFIGNSVCNGYIHISGVALFAIRAAAAESQCRRPIWPGYCTRGPQCFIKTESPTMQMVWWIIDRQGEEFPIEMELCAWDSPRNPADDRSEVIGIFQVRLE